MSNNYLITGGSGKLGRELQNFLPGNYPSHADFDIMKMDNAYACDALVHLAAYTDVDGAEIHKWKCFDINVIGTYNLLSIKLPFVYISTEHVNGNGVYFQSKLAAEMLVKSLAPSYLIIRTLFKPRPFPWKQAWTNQMTQGDYVDVIAKLIAKEVKKWDMKESKTVYVGTGRKSIYDLAKQTRPDVKPILLEDPKRPKDYL